MFCIFGNCDKFYFVSMFELCRDEINICIQIGEFAFQRNSFKPFESQDVREQIF